MCGSSDLVPIVQIDTIGRTLEAMARGLAGRSLQVYPASTKGIVFVRRALPRLSRSLDITGQRSSLRRRLVRNGIRLAKIGEHQLFGRQLAERNGIIGGHR